MTQYELIEGTPETNGADHIKRTDSNGQVWIIPTDPANSDYQRYLAWLENPQAEHLNGSVDGEAL
jgi:hypothetical protein